MATPDPEDSAARVRTDLAIGLARAQHPAREKPSCPRCTCPRVQRWGSFSGRRRYRCTGCCRTFSDLTGTILARCRRPDAWTRYLEAMEDRLTLRAAARHAGIGLRTSFRWRHRILEASRVARPRVPTTVAAVFLSRLRVARCAASGGSSAGATYPWIITLLGAVGRTPARTVTSPPATPCPRHEGRQSERIEFGIVDGCKRFPDRGSLSPFLRQLIVPDGRVVGGTCRRAAFEEASSNGAWLWVPNPADPIEKARAARAREIGAGLRGWLAPFHGVSSRYLPNYLEWRTAWDPPTRGTCRPNPLPPCPRSHPQDLPDSNGGRSQGGRWGSQVSRLIRLLCREPSPQWGASFPTARCNSPEEHRKPPGSYGPCAPDWSHRNRWPVTQGNPPRGTGGPRNSFRTGASGQHRSFDRGRSGGGRASSTVPVERSPPDRSRP